MRKRVLDTGAGRRRQHEPPRQGDQQELRPGQSKDRVCGEEGGPRSRGRDPRSGGARAHRGCHLGESHSAETHSGPLCPSPDWER